MTTIIDDTNIRQFIVDYMFDKSKLPPDLQNKPINDWIVSRVTDMSKLFTSFDKEPEPPFNEPIDQWDVSNVTDMSDMFNPEFNQPINTNTNGDKWNVSRVTNMSGMFWGCTNFNQPLDNWDVSGVTDMTAMFRECTNFNQPLNTNGDKWNVSRVTNMSHMFSDCTHFNQPLDNWNVSGVTDMMNMFSDCTDFNQNLNNWSISNGTDVLYMFDDSGISEENKPTLPRRRQSAQVDPLQVHRAASKINYEKLNTFLKGKLDNNKDMPTDIYFPKFIKDSITSLIETSNTTTETQQNQKNDLIEIMSTLNRINYLERSILLRKSIFYVLNYVLLQPDSFKQLYLKAFFEDCIHAYEGVHGMTCANGALERIIFSLLPACTTNEGNEDYKTIVDIINANPNVLIHEYILDWYKSHKNDTDENFSKKNNEEKKKDLKRFLLEKFPNENDLIETTIQEYDKNVGFDADSFTYGGKRRTKTKNNSKKRIKKSIRKSIRKSIKKGKKSIKKGKKSIKKSTKNSKKLIKKSTKKNKKELEKRIRKTMKRT